MKIETYSDIRTGFCITWGKNEYDGLFCIGSCSISIFGNIKSSYKIIFNNYVCSYNLLIEERNGKTPHGRDYWIRFTPSRNGLINRFKKTYLYTWIYFKFLL